MLIIRDRTPLSRVVIHYDGLASASASASASACAVHEKQVEEKSHLVLRDLALIM